MFGSFATGVARPDSDIDILVICSEKKTAKTLNDELEKVEDLVVKKFGNKLAPIIIREKEFRSRFAKRDKLVRNIAHEGKVIFGASITDLVRYDS